MDRILTNHENHPARRSGNGNGRNEHQHLQVPWLVFNHIVQICRNQLPCSILPLLPVSTSMYASNLARLGRLCRKPFKKKASGISCRRKTLHFDQTTPPLLQFKPQQRCIRETGKTELPNQKTSKHVERHQWMAPTVVQH